MDGGNLAPLLQCRFLTAPYPLLNIGIESLHEQICSNDGNLAPPHTEQVSMIKRGCGDASSRHGRCLLFRWCKISSIHRLDILGEDIQMSYMLVERWTALSNLFGVVLGSKTTGNQSLPADMAPLSTPPPAFGVCRLRSANRLAACANATKPCFLVFFTENG